MTILPRDFRSAILVEMAVRRQYKWTFDEVLRCCRRVARFLPEPIDPDGENKKLVRAVIKALHEMELGGELIIDFNRDTDRIMTIELTDEARCRLTKS